MDQTDFLQSADWAKFQGAIGRALIEADGVRFFVNPLPFGGSYLYCPHPDIADPAAFLERAIALARRGGAWFVRVEPNVGSASLVISNQQSAISTIAKANSRSLFTVRPTLAVQPPDTWHVPLASDEAMLAAMHEKTRYNIRLAEKRGVTVRFSSDPTDVTILTNLLDQTGERAGIRIHPASYYRTMMEVLSSDVILEPGETRHRESMHLDPQSGAPDVSSDFRLRMTDTSDHLTVELAIAESKGRAIAAALIAHYGDRAIYLHGGSNYEQRALMAPHLLHWRVMRQAAAAGKRIYDMGGIAPAASAISNQQSVISNSELADRRSPIADRSVHPWVGITRFKMGFGGHAVHYPPAVDVVVNRGMYRIYVAGRMLSRSIR